MSLFFVGLLLGFALLTLLAAGFLWTGRRQWRRFSITLAVIAALSWLAYSQLGALGDLRAQAWMQRLQAGEALGEDERRDFRALLASLGEETGGERYHYLLGHDFFAEGEYEKAREQFGALRGRGSQESEVNMAYIQSDFLARGGVFGEEVRVLARSLADSGHPALLEMLVLDALRSNDQRAFMQYWPSFSATPRGTELGRRLGMDPAEQAGASVQPTIAVHVSVASAIHAEPDTPVFVLARDAQTPGPPLAVKRLPFADLPALVELSDKDAMLDSNRLSDASQVEVVARLAYSGGPIAAEGDLEISSGLLDLEDGEASIELVIE